MRRRQFIAFVGLATAVGPFAARAQQPGVPVIGVLQVGTPTAFDLSGFRQGLKDAGYVEGRNLAIEYRWANDDPDRLPELAIDLVRRQVRVIVALFSPLQVRAAMAATNKIPIVFGFGSDPVGLRIVASLNQPGGNVTGMTSMSTDLVGKQLAILHELLPQATHFGVLSNPISATHEIIVKSAQAAASAIGQTIEILTASTANGIDAVFAHLVDEKRVQGLLVSNDPFFIAQRVQLANAEIRYAVPAIYPFREQAKVGGLMSYGPNLADRDREVGHYVGRILNGERPGDLPVMRSAKFEFLINMKTAKALGLAVPNSMQLLADDVIE